jgi:hypothetical protein
MFHDETHKDLKKEMDELKQLAQTFFQNVRGFLDEQLPKVLSNSFHFNQGKEDGKLGIDQTVEGGYYEDITKNLLIIYSAKEIIPLRKEFSRHYSNLEKYKARHEQECEKYKKEQEELTKLSSSANPSMLSGLLYFIIGVLLLVSEFPFTYVVFLPILQMNALPQWSVRLISVLVALSISFLTVFFKIFVEEIILWHKDEKRATGMRRRNLWFCALFVSIFFIPILLGMIRASSAIVEVNVLFIFLALIFPLISSIFLIFGTRYLSIAFREGNARVLQEKIRECRLYLRKVAIELMIRKKAYSSVVKSCEDAHRRGVQTGHLNPDESLYEFVKRSVKHNTAAVFSEGKFDGNAGGDGNMMINSAAKGNPL